MVAPAIDKLKSFVALTVSVCGVAGLVACASTPPEPTSEMGSEALTGVEVERQGESTVIMLQGLMNPDYTAAIDAESSALVLELQNVDVGAMTGAGEDWQDIESANQVLVYDGLVNHVTVSSQGGDAGGNARIEVSLATDAAYDIYPSDSGLSISLHESGESPSYDDEYAWDDTAMDSGELDAEGAETELDADSYWSAEAQPLEEEEFVAEEIAEPVEMTPATQLTSIESLMTADGALLHLKADGVIESVETLTLEAPDRLVIDLPGIENKVASAAIAVDSLHVSRVRIGSHPDKVRVVLDGGEAAEGFASKSVTPVADGMFVAVGTGDDLAEALDQGIALSNTAYASNESQLGEEAKDTFADSDEGELATDADAGWNAEASSEESWAGTDEVWGDEAGSEELAVEAEAGFEAATGEPTTIFGVNFDSTSERDRIAVLAANPVDYTIYEPSSETIVVSFSNASIEPAAEGRIERELGGPTSLISAFQQPDVDAEVRVVVVRAPGLAPVVSRQGGMLFLDFPNTGVAAAEAPAFEVGRMADLGEPMTVNEQGIALSPEISAADGSMALDEAGMAMAAAAVADESIPGVPGAVPTEVPVADAAAVAPVAATDPAGMDADWMPAPLDAPAPSAVAPAQAAAPASLEPPAAVEILAEGGLVDGKQYVGRRISLDFKNVPVADVLRLIAEVSDLNIIAGSEVDGSVTIRLVEVPWDQALDVILLTKGLGFVRVGNVLRIAPADVLKVEEEVRLQERRNKEKLEDLEVKLLPINYAAAGDVSKMVSRLLSPRGSVDIDERTNTLIVKDIASVVGEVSALAAALDTETPQVLIEAKIVEAGLDFRRELGSEWGVSTNEFEDAFSQSGINRDLGGEDFRFINENSVVFSNPINSAATGAITMGALVLDEQFNLDVTLAAVESSGDGKVISSPRIVTLDNTTATISQGTSIPFQTFEGGDAKLEFVDAVLQLMVTPHITANKSVIMKLAVQRNAPDDSVATPTGSPAIAKNEAESQALVHDGQTLVLGGIYTIVKSERQSRVPYLHRIPVIGNAFKNKSWTDSRKELLVFITPRIL